MDYSRRRVLAGGIGAALGVGLAGCLGDRTDAPFGYASFFTLEDWANQVGDGHLEFESPVPIGRIGHGWEPDLQTTATIAESEVFVYLDLPDFAWAQNAAETLRRDYDDIEVIDALTDVPLLHHGDDHAHDGHDDHGEEDEGDHGDGHDDEGERVDPHVWLDPIRARTIVGNIRDGLVLADPGNDDAYRENADRYLDRLDALHHSFVTAFEDRSRSLVVLAGHDSFRYFADRYDFEVVTPVGVAPDASPSPGEIADALEVIEEHGVEVVLTDVFESDQLAETILDNSACEEILEVTPAEGTTQSWLDNGWGYLEQMETINLPAFKTALGVS